MSLFAISKRGEMRNFSHWYALIMRNTVMIARAIAISQARIHPRNGIKRMKSVKKKRRNTVSACFA